jgi:pilus assembly protein CpaF
MAPQPWPVDAEPTRVRGLTLLPADRRAERALREEIRGAVGRLRDEGQAVAPGPGEAPRIRALIREACAGWQRRAAMQNTPPLAAPEAVEQRLFDDILGMGPLQPYLDDDRVEELMMNGPFRAFIVVDGHTLLVPELVFDSDEELLGLVKRALGPLGRRLDASSPMVDVRLPDGSRLNAVIAPVSSIGACVTIRKFVMKAHTIAQLVALDSLTDEVAAFCDACVRGGANFLISGPTGSGKTTILNCLGAAVPAEDQRVVTIEEVGELLLYRQLPNCVALEGRGSNVEGAGAISIRDLVRNALRMRPSRLVVGECRGAEALDVLQAMNTGHDGSMTAIHANSPRDALDRLVTLAAMAEERLSTEVLTKMVARTVEIVLQLRVDQTGRRRVANVFEVTGQESSGGAPIVTGNDLWTLDPRRDRLVWTGIRPRLLEKLASKGVRFALPPERPEGRSA